MVVLPPVPKIWQFKLFAALPPLQTMPTMATVSVCGSIGQMLLTTTLL